MTNPYGSLADQARRAADNLHAQREAARKVSQEIAERRRREAQAPPDESTVESAT